MARSIAPDYEAKRLAILKNAAGFFAKNGFDRSSMNELANVCGVSKALIYHYYNSKDALLFDIVNTHLTELVEVVKHADDKAARAEENLRAIVHAVLAAYLDADAQHKLQTEAMASLPADERAILADLQRQIVSIVSGALRAVTPEVYDARPEVLHPVAMSLFGMVNWFYMWNRPGKGMSREDYADLCTDLMLNGVEGISRAR